MKERIIPIIKFMGLHIALGVVYSIFVILAVILHIDYDIHFIYNFFTTIQNRMVYPFLLDITIICIIDTLITFLKLKNINGRFKIIKMLSLWILGIIFSCLTFVVALYFYYII